MGRPWTRWRFFDITHADHVLCNPLSVAKLDEMIGLLDLWHGQRVIDIACGKGELLVRLVERYGIGGVGVDPRRTHPPTLRSARGDTRARGGLEVLEIDGAEYRASRGRFDLACCLGASWTLRRATRARSGRWRRSSGRAARSLRRRAVLAARAGPGVPRRSGLRAEAVRHPTDEPSEIAERPGLTPMYALRATRTTRPLEALRGGPPTYTRGDPARPSAARPTSLERRTAGH